MSANWAVPPYLENYISGVRVQNPCCGAAYEAARRGRSRAINVIHRLCCGRQGARIRHGHNDTSSRPRDDWRGVPVVCVCPGDGGTGGTMMR